MKNKARISNKQGAKMRTRGVLTYVAWSFALVSVIGVGVFVYLNLGNIENVFAAGSTYTSKQTGNWTANSSWLAGSAPGTTGLNGDNITINGTHTITSGSLSVDNNVTITIKSGATLYISGNLTVDNNLILNNSGTLIITGGLSAHNNAAVTINGGGTAKISGNAAFNNNATLLVQGTLQVVGSLAFGNNNSFSGNGNVVLGSGCSFWAGPGNCSTGTLPVKLLSFTAEPANGSVVLNWKTATEENNEFFTLERTSDGVNYKAIATIPGAGTTVKITNYSYEDSSPIVGKSYYRLSQTDYDGKSETFKHITVDVAATEGSSFTIFPNPLTGSELNVSIQDAGEGSIEILNMKGEKLSTHVVSGDEKEFKMHLGDNFQPGFYYVNYKTASGVKTAKLLKQ